MQQAPRLFIFICHNSEHRALFPPHFIAKA